MVKDGNAAGNDDAAAHRAEDTMATETFHCYLSALDNAAHAIEQARRIRPDPGLDHAIDRLRMLLQDASPSCTATRRPARSSVSDEPSRWGAPSLISA